MRVCTGRVEVVAGLPVFFSGMKKWLVLSLLSVMAACTPLKYEEVLQMARSNDSVKSMASQVAKGSQGRLVELPGQDFYLVGNRKVVSSARFSRVMQESCETAYNGRLVDSNTRFPLTKRITASQLAKLAGRNGSITRYLSSSIARFMDSAVNEHRRRLRDEVIRRERAPALYSHSGVVCMDYIDGLLKIYFVADSLSTDSTADSDVIYWAVAGTRTFDGEIDKQVRRALTSANRQLWEDKEVIEALEGSSAGGNIKVFLQGSKEFRHIFHVKLEFDHKGDQFARIEPAKWKYFLSSGGLAYETRMTRDGLDAEGRCAVRTDTEVLVHSDGACRIEFDFEIEHFSLNSDPVRIEVEGQRIDLLPLTRYDLQVRQ